MVYCMVLYGDDRVLHVGDYTWAFLVASNTQHSCISGMDQLNITIKLCLQRAQSVLHVLDVNAALVVHGIIIILVPREFFSQLTNLWFFHQFI